MVAITRAWSSAAIGAWRPSPYGRSMMPFSTIVERTNGSDSHSEKNALVHEQNKLGRKAYISQRDIIPDRRTATRQQCTFDSARIDRKCFLGPCVDCFVYRSLQ